MLTAVDTVEGVLRDHEAELGSDYAAYRNHVYRVLNFCVAQWLPNPESLEKLAIAAAFHDLGIWTDGTFDYVPPSIRLATAYLLRTNRPEWTEEIGAMILEHHKISRYGGDSSPLVERFRRADWIDVSFGLRRFGLPRSVVAPVLSALPNEGFHRRLIQLSLARLRTNPLSPLPMFRL
jgi:HD domain